MSKAIGTASILPVLGKYKLKVMKMSRESVAQTQLEKKSQTSIQVQFWLEAVKAYMYTHF